MHRKSIVAAASLTVALALPAGAVDMIDSVFEASFSYGGTEHRLDGARVPRVPGTCYTWWIRLAEGQTPLSAVERLILPEPPADWGEAATDPDDGIDISDDGKLAVSTFAPELDADGWFSKGWCVAEGDPLGQHRIEVAVDGTELTAYDFEVVLPEDYAWPALPQPDPLGRSVDHSW